MFFVYPQSIVENYLEVGGRRIRVSPGHECKSGDWCEMIKRLRRRVVSIGQRGIIQRAQGDCHWTRGTDIPRKMSDR